MSHKVITASAGTGKTFSLSIQYICCLLAMLRDGEGIQCFRRILVITFTKKATAEIRTRVFAHLRDLTEHRRTSSIYPILKEKTADIMDEISDEIFDKLTEVYRDMCINRHRLQIRTIDGFINLIWTNVTARLSNITGGTVINGEHDDDIYLELMDRLWHSEFRRTFEAIYLTNQDTISEAKTADKCIAILRSLTAQCETFVMRDGNVPETDDAAAAKHLDDARSDYAVLIDMAVDVIRSRKKNNYPTPDDLGKLGESFKSDVAVLPVSDGDAASDTFCAMLKSKICDGKWLIDNALDVVNEHRPSQLFNGSSGKVSFPKEQKPLRDEYDVKIRTSLIKYLFHKNLAADNISYQAMLNGIYRMYNEIVSAHQEFTHGDVLMMAYRTITDPNLHLCDENGITDEFKHLLSVDFRYVMIDEFQDTSVLQWASLLPFLKSPKVEFIIVGDEKQAIYGWRGGEKGLLGRVSHIFETELSDLDMSYRSYHNVIKYVNDFFATRTPNGETKEQTGLKAAVNDMLGEQSWSCPAVKYAKDDDSIKGQSAFYFDRHYGTSKNNPEPRDESMCIDYFVRNVIIPRIKGESEGDTAQYGRTAVLARKNGSLEEIAHVLNAYGIPTYIESSSSLFAHNAVIGIMSLLRFLAFDDYYSLFEFVRSPIINADSESFRQLLLAYRDGRQSIDFDNVHIEHFDKMFEIIRQLRCDVGSYHSMTALISRIYNDFGVQHIFTKTSDAKALHQLLETALEFDGGLVDYTKSLQGFLIYTDDIYTDAKPDSVECVNAVKLMTIHKSKGLEFDNVFVYNYIGRPKNDTSPIVTVFGYNGNYSATEDFIMMKGKYRTIIRKSAECDFSDVPFLKRTADNIILNDKKEFIGELNNLYVAMTRPVVNLVVYNAIESSKGYDDDLSELYKNVGSTDSLLRPKSIVLAMYEQFAANDAGKSEGQVISFCDGEWGVPNDKSDESDSDCHRMSVSLDKMSKYIGYNLWQEAVHSLEQEQISDEEWTQNVEAGKTSYGERKRLFGIAVHYYMSKIIYASDEEKRIALAGLYGKYGNIFDDKTIEQIRQITDEFIGKFRYLFDKHKWDRVHTELWLSDKDGTLRRLDRIMFNTNEKKILIADYKTGKYDQQQLSDYKSLIANLLEQDNEHWEIDAKDFSIYKE